MILISILQIYNWFSHTHICTLLALYFCAELCGYLTPIPLLPAEYYYQAAYPKCYFILGTIFILLAVLDLYIFTFSPLEKNILVDHRKSILLSPEEERKSVVSPTNSMLSPLGRDQQTFEIL